MSKQQIYGPNRKDSVKRTPANIWKHPLPRGPKPRPIVLELGEVRRRLLERNGSSPEGLRTS